MCREKDKLIVYGKRSAVVGNLWKKMCVPQYYTDIWTNHSRNHSAIVSNVHLMICERPSVLVYVTLVLSENMEQTASYPKTSRLLASNTNIKRHVNKMGLNRFL